MRIITVAIIDDEPLARLRLRRLLSNLKDISIVGECENATQLEDFTNKNAVDLIFLDIEIQDKNGFDLIRKIPLPKPEIIFVTAYSEYAAKAFDIEALDYLVKPFTNDRLNLAIDKVRNKISAMDEKSSSPSCSIERIAISVGKKTKLIDTCDIDFIRAQANYIEIHVGPRSFALRRPISWIEEQLNQKKFMRVHRSYIVQIERIQSISNLPSGKCLLILKNGKEISSGRSYKTKLQDALFI